MKRKFIAKTKTGVELVFELIKVDMPQNEENQRSQVNYAWVDIIFGAERVKSSVEIKWAGEIAWHLKIVRTDVKKYSSLPIPAAKVWVRVVDQAAFQEAVDTQEKMQREEIEKKNQAEYEEAQKRGVFWVVSVGGDSHKMNIFQAYAFADEENAAYNEKYREEYRHHRQVRSFPRALKYRDVKWELEKLISSLPRLMHGGKDPYTIDGFYGQVWAISDADFASAMKEYEEIKREKERVEAKKKRAKIEAAEQKTKEAWENELWVFGSELVSSVSSMLLHSLGAKIDRKGKIEVWTNGHVRFMKTLSPKTTYDIKEELKDLGFGFEKEEKKWVAEYTEEREKGILELLKKNDTKADPHELGLGRCWECGSWRWPSELNRDGYCGC